MLTDAKTLTSEQKYNADVCIIGAGVAGITLAIELGQMGISTLIIDGGDENFTMESQNLYAPGESIKGYEDITYDRLRFLGGSSNHWQNSTGQFTPADFKKRDWIPNSGWPIEFEDIAPFYNKAGFYCGTGTDGYSAEYWLKEMRENDPTQDTEELNLGINKVAIPPTRFFFVHGKNIIENENIHLIKNANLIDLSFDSGSKNVETITFVSYGSDLKHSVTAKKFVLCCGGIENARFMLIFNAKYNNMLGNQHDTVGRFFMEHPILRAANFYPSNSVNLDALSEGTINNKRVVKGFMQLEDESTLKNKTINLRLPLHSKTKYQISEGIRSFHYWTDENRKDWFPENSWTHMYNILSDLDMFAEAIARKSFSTELFEHAKEFGGYEIAMMFEQIPHRDNKITLSEQKDELGIQRVNVDWNLLRQDKDNVWKSLGVLANELGKADIGRLNILDEYEDQVFGEKMFFSHHHMGTTRMAESEKHGVVDRNLKVFGTNNFYIGGSSVFTTSSHVPPTLTISAFSVRLAKHLGQLCA